MSTLAFSTKPSQRRLDANRANAQLSTGPTTPEGKAKSSLNAVKTGLTGRTVLLSSEDVTAYEAHLERFRRAFQPVGDRELQLVQNLADTQWRLDRIPNLEAGLFALGRLRFAELFADRHLLDAYILLHDAKHFQNLHLQESRLHRRYGQDAKELKELQAQRQKEQEEQAKKTAPPKTLTASVGFEFTNPISALVTGGGNEPTQEGESASHLDHTGSYEVAIKRVGIQVTLSGIRQIQSKPAREATRWASCSSIAKARATSRSTAC